MFKGIMIRGIDKDIFYSMRLNIELLSILINNDPTYSVLIKSKGATSNMGFGPMVLKAAPTAFCKSFINGN